VGIKGKSSGILSGGGGMVELGTAFHSILAQITNLAYVESGHREVSASGSYAGNSGNVG